MDEELTIDEVMRLTDEDLTNRCERTLGLFPLLRAFYDRAFVEELLRHRNQKNYCCFSWRSLATR